MIRDEKLQNSDKIDGVMASRIMTDGGFKADLDYLDERADQLVTKKQKTTHRKSRGVDVMGKFRNYLNQ